MLSDGVRSFTYDYSNKLIIADGHTYTYNADVLRIRNLCENGIIYMRARYYSPEMKRFINADIVAGSITNTVTLNRFAYVNGNPVSFVDPFGLSAEKRDCNEVNTEFYGNCSTAILVTDFSLEVVGHSELYFLDETKTWWRAEFNLRGNGEGLDMIKNKHKAQAYWEKDKIPPPYDPEFTREFNYVILKGDFNESVKLAQYYAKPENKNLDGYNLFVNNCADYTNLLLNVADVDGMFSQIMMGEEDFISIPLIREFKTSTATYLDSQIDRVSANVQKTGKIIKEFDFIGSGFIGDVVIDTGILIDKGTDFVGDIAGTALTLYNNSLRPIETVFDKKIKTICDLIGLFL